MSSHTRARRGAAIGAIIATAAGLGLAANPSAADATTATTAAKPKVSYVSVFGTSKAKTSTGKAVSASVNVSKSNEGGYLNVGLAHKTESHSWAMDVPKGALKLSNAGKGTFRPKASATAPIALASLSIKPAGKAKVAKCHGTAVSKSRPVRISGKFWVNTKSGKHGWGTVGSKKKGSFTFKGTASWSYDNDATCDYKTPCISTSSWYAFGDRINISGDLKHEKVTASRSTQLKKPAGAARYDSRTAGLKSSKFTRNKGAKTAKLVLVGKKSAGSTGSLTIAGGNQDTYSGTCGKNNTTTSTYWTGSVKGKGSLKVHDIYGAMGIAKDSSISMSITTVKKG